MEDQVTMVTEEMDLTQWLPDLSNAQSSLTTWMRVIVIAGPVLMLLLGLYYFFLSPPEANYRAGYRFRYAMSKVSVWQFTQRLAGLVYGGMGLVLTIIMIICMISFSDRTPPDLVWFTVKCILWQIILVMVATLAVNIYIMVKFDPKGNLREKSAGKKPVKKRK